MPRLESLKENAVESCDHLKSLPPRAPPSTGKPRRRNRRVYLMLPTTRCRVLEELTGSQLVKKFTAFYGTQKFVTAFTSARHLSLSWARSIQSTPPQITSWSN